MSTDRTLIAANTRKLCNCCRNYSNLNLAHQPLHIQFQDQVHPHFCTRPILVIFETCAYNFDVNSSDISSLSSAISATFRSADSGISFLTHMVGCNMAQLFLFFGWNTKKGCTWSAAAEHLFSENLKRKSSTLSVCFLNIWIAKRKRAGRWGGNSPFHIWNNFCSF